MGRRLSLFCPCFPQKQRDNLSSRSVYLDDSSGPEDYTDDEDDHDLIQEQRQQQQLRHQSSRARLQSFLAQSSSSSSSPYTKRTTQPPLENAWPSTLSNGRFSRYSSHVERQRKPNPFQEPYRDDDDDEEEEEDGGGGDSDDRRRRRERRKRVTAFESYHDDDSEEGDEPGSKGIIDNSLRIHAKEATVSTPHLVSLAPVAQRMRVPKSRQRNLFSSDEENEVEEVAEDEDAEEVIDVDALISEQERIARQMTAQEEALRDKEEAAIVAKRKSAIRAAERRGLLRLDEDDDQWPRKKVVVGKSLGSGEFEDDDLWNRPARVRQTQEVPTRSAAAPTPSMASSFVGGEDAFDQELKMMTLDLKNKGNKRSDIFSVADTQSAEFNGAATADKRGGGSSEYVKRSLLSEPETEEPALQGDGQYSTNAAMSPQAKIRETISISAEPDEHYPVDPFNPSTPLDIHGQKYPAAAEAAEAATVKSTASTIAIQSKGYPDKDIDKESVVSVDTFKSSRSSLEQETVAAAVPVVAAPSIMGTFTSLYNTGASFMGYFGSGQPVVQPQLAISDPSSSSILSESKIGGYPSVALALAPAPTSAAPSRKHLFDYRAAASAATAAVAAAVVGPSTFIKKQVVAEEDDDSSIDDYDF
ncbi:hypothetical protein BGZ83_008422 [Gryganskiella cystojenkinii]|nr:hypothetical protein BGZ83_008422 [Gryganskiella cystojenkinii]